MTNTSSNNPKYAQKSLTFVDFAVMSAIIEGTNEPSSVQPQKIKWEELEYEILPEWFQRHQIDPIQGVVPSYRVLHYTIKNLRQRGYLTKGAMTVTDKGRELLARFDSPQEYPIEVPTIKGEINWFNARYAPVV